MFGPLMDAPTMGTPGLGLLGSGAVAGTEVSFRATTKAVVEMSMGPIHKGDINDIDIVFRDAHSKELIDPTVVYLDVQSPSQAVSGAFTTYTFGASAELTRLDTGSYRAAIACTEEGTWLFTWRCPGPVGQCAEPGYFDVDAALPT